MESECKPDHKFIKFGDCSINCETAQIPKGRVSEYAVPLNASQGLKPHVNHEAIAICIHMCHSVKTWLVFPYWGMVINPMIWIPNNIYIYKDYYSNEMVINPYPFYYIYWLVVSNMVFIVHFIYGMSSFPLKNSYFSRWLKPPTTIYKDLHSQDIGIPMAWDDRVDHIFQCLRSPHKHPHCMVPKYYGDV